MTTDADTTTEDIRDRTRELAGALEVHTQMLINANHAEYVDEVSHVAQQLALQFARVAVMANTYAVALRRKGAA